jgi:hypothetical protein
MLQTSEFPSIAAASHPGRAAAMTWLLDALVWEYRLAELELRWRS